MTKILRVALIIATGDGRETPSVDDINTAWTQMTAGSEGGAA